MTKLMVKTKNGVCLPTGTISDGFLTRFGMVEIFMWSSVHDIWPFFPLISDDNSDFEK